MYVYLPTEHPTRRESLNASCRTENEHVVDVVEDDDSEVESPSQVWQEFLDETSLLGIQRTFQRKSFIWLVASVLCTAMGILQSWRTAEEYFGNKSLQRILVTNKAQLPFPSVTACSDILLPEDFNVTLIPGYNTSVDKPHSCESEEIQDLWETLMEKNDERLIEFLRQLPAEERSNLSISVNQFLLSCTFGGKPCDNGSEKHFNFFNNPFLGNCFTFNPSFAGTGFEVDVATRLVLEFKTDNSGYRLEAGKLHIPMLLHSPGSAPILGSTAVYDVYLGRHVAMPLKLSERLFVEHHSEKKRPCVQPTDETFRRRSVYYSENSQYLYSLEACMSSCEQKYNKELCHVIDAILPIQSQEYEDSVNTSLPPVSCDNVPDLDMHLCDCPLPCRVLQYSITTDTIETPVPDCEKRHRKRNSETFVGGVAPVHIKHFDHHNAKVSIFFASNIYETTAEELQHSFSQFLGILGGNISLWVGICVLSLLEVIDLVISILIATYKKRKKTAKQMQEDNIALSIIQSTRPQRRQLATSMGQLETKI